MQLIEHYLMESPLGTLTLVNTNGVLSGLYMPDHLTGPTRFPRVENGIRLRLSAHSTQRVFRTQTH
jgi:hypothetical protein